MINEKRVKLMTRMALYEEKEGREDFRISAYYQKDYTSLNTWITVIWTTIGYVAVAVAMMFVFLDEILNDINMTSLMVLAITVISGYLVTVLITIGVANRFYRKKHMEARKRVKKFNHDLIRLGKMYEKETK